LIIGRCFLVGIWLNYTAPAGHRWCGVRYVNCATKVNNTLFSMKEFVKIDGRNLLRKGDQYMQKLHQFTAVIERDEDIYVSLCPELDIASQGSSVEEARKNLQEAIELFFETASKEEIRERLHDEIFVTRVEVAVG
jgi:predicted RNase H-like HicB family nuclease